MPDILQIRSPFDGHLIAELPLAGEQEVEHALEKTYAVFRDQSRWLPRYKRIDILEKFARLMEAHAEEITLRAAEEGGKPYQDTVVEVKRAINGVKIAIAELYHLAGEEVPMGMTAASVNRLAFTTREPIGVVLAISAFNHPVNLIIHQVVPAIAAGCPVIVKPASATPLSCFKLVELLREAGLPDEYCIPLVCNRQLSEKMASDKRIGYLTFIGSAEVGWHLRSILAPGTRVALEHGGVAPVIVDRTANPDEIAPAIAKGGFYHAGQVCVSVQKVFAHEGIALQLARKLAEIADSQKVGDPLDPATDIGPLISQDEVIRIHDWVQEALSGGAQLLSGGNPALLQSYSPTVLFNPPSSVRVSTHEVFGPVICVYPFTDLRDAISRANSLRYAFQASVFTKDIDMAMQAAGQLNASAVMINDHTAFRVDWMPFGGRDESGIGMGGIPYSMKEMTREKLFVFHSRES